MPDDELEVPSEAGPGPSSAAPYPPTARPANSLLSYFGNGSARPMPTASGSYSSSSATMVAAKPKAKRTKAVPADQARLGTTSAGEGSTSGWALGRKLVEEVQAASDPKAKARKKATKVELGEEAERKEMVKRAKAEKKSKGANGGKAGTAVALAETTLGEQEPADDSLEIIPTSAQAEASGNGPILPAKPVPAGPRVSDTKRKRSHHKATAPLPSISYPSSQASTTLASSPPTITLSSSTESDTEDNPVKFGAKAAKLPRSSPSSLTHPLFFRSSSAISKGASQDDAINIDDSPKRPRTVIDLANSPRSKPVLVNGLPKSASAAPAKVVHSFFGPKRAAPPPVALTASGNATEVKAVAKPAAKDKVHSFFQPGPKGVPGKLVDGWGGDRKMGEEWLAPFPGRVWPSHLGYSDLPVGPLGQLRKRRECSPGAIKPLSSFFSSLRPIPSRPLPSPLPLPSDTPPHVSHPAIRSIPRRSRDSNQETWCERYRPLTASQVAGNEVEATYLRDWLQLLSVGQDGSGSTRKVTRRVPHRKAQLLDGWIADDINDFDDDPDESLDPDQAEFQAFEDVPTALDARPEAYEPFDQRLANTILLSGPHGSGKSAAVYAVAEELGWEVFEVYPGIGRRTGSNLMSLVGDVGRNHVIAGKGKGKVTPKKAKAAVAPLPKVKPAAASFFKNVGAAAPAKPPAGVTAAKGVARKRANQLPPSSQGSMDDPMRLDDSDEGEDADDGVEVLEDRKHGFRETLILLDEADLLFEEEGSFWPSVITLIAESRRPVVITCNDPERIPISSLPLQAILQFQPPARDLALSLLSAIAANESLPSLDVYELYDASFSSPPNLLAQPTPLVPNGHEPIPTFDLRRAITQMQLDRNKSRPFAGTGKDGLDLKEMCMGLEQRSFVDAWVVPRSWAVIEVSEIDRYASTSDDLLGVHVLPKPEVHPDRPVLAAYSAQEEIGDYLLSLAPRLPATFSSHDLGLKQIQHTRALLPLLDPLIPLSSNLLPHFSLFTDYIPTLRDIVLTDDILEIAEEEALARGGERVNRKTGRPVRTVTGWLKGKEEGGYVRYLKDVGKDGEAVVRNIRLGGASASAV